jgi:hypothetical protein
MNYAAKEAEKVAVLENAGVELLELSAQDRAKLSAAAMKIWDKIAARSELSAKAVEIVRKQQQEYGHIE